MAEKQRPKIGIAVYIVNDKNQVLMLHEHRLDSGWTWAPPGGHLEFGEEFLDCVKREAKEESNLDVSDAELWAINNNFNAEQQTHFVNVDFLAKNYKGEAKIMEPEKCDNIGWFDLNSLPQPLLFAPKNFFKNNPACLCRSGKKYFDCHGK